MVHQFVRFQPENLVYFGIMMPVFAMLTPNVRMTTLWTVLSGGALLGFVAMEMPGMVVEYLSIALAGLLAAVGATRLVRGALLNALTARHEAVRRHAEAVRLSAHDPLTGLPNRRSFFEAFESRRSALARHGRKFLLILFDLDGFKPVNDVYGHAAGDELLKALAGRLRAVSPATALPARLGGDEFALLADHPEREGDIRRVAMQIADALSLPYSLESGVVRVSSSAGVYVCDRTDLSAAAMMERADHALYRAKKDRRGQAVVFSDSHETDLVNVHHVDRALRQADLKRELSVLFQPQFDLETSQVCSFEALARWTSPELGEVPPSVFIAAAERSNLMGQVTQIVIGKSLKALEMLPAHLRLAVNLSAHDLMSEGGVRQIIEQVRLSGIDPARLEFEITETAMLTDQGLAARSLADLQALGASTALDDFGSGYSNFAYLQQLHVSKLKIDRSFVKPLLGDPQAEKILRTLISLSKSLGMVCVVEGVEEPRQLARISEFDARYVQGFLVARPMPPEEIADFLAGVPAWVEEVREARNAAACSGKSYRRLA